MTQGIFSPASESFSGGPEDVFGSASFKARLERAFGSLAAGFVLSDASSCAQCCAFDFTPAQLAAQTGLVPIRLSTGELIGRAAPAWAKRICRMPGLLGDGAVSLVLDREKLIDFGLAMKAAGLSQGWRGELLDLFDLETSGTPSAARLERSLYRPLGALTRAVHLSARLRDPVDEYDPVYVMGQRSRTKRVGPGLWDGLAAGMVGAGESPNEALVREAAEEAGLSADAARSARMLQSFLVSREVSAGWMLEASYAHDLVLPLGFEPQAVDQEVERFAVFSAVEVLDLIERGQVMHEAAASLLFSMRETRAAGG